MTCQLSPEDDEDSGGLTAQLELTSTNPGAAEKADVGNGAFLNLGFSDFDDDKHVTMPQLKLIVDDTARSVLDTRAEWTAHLNVLTQNRQKLWDRIELRRQAVTHMVNEYSQKLSDKLDQMMASQLELGSKMVSFLDGAGEQIEELFGVVHSEASQDVDKKAILDVIRDISDNVSNNIPIWLPLELQHGQPEGYLVEHLYGTIQVIDKELYPLHLTDHVDLIRSFQAKTTWDEISCGIVDMAVTEDGDILVADKNNKLLKMFDKNGEFKMLVGHGQIKDPTRVRVLRHTNSILVTDNALRRVKMFHKNGTFVCDFICDIKYPTSICESYKGEIVIVEFETKTAMVYNVNGVVLYSFKVTLPNPTHLACSPNGLLVFSDWRNHALRAFHIDGEMAWRYRERGAGDNQLEQPQGICFDPFGHLLVADSSNHRIQVLNEKGEHVRVLIPKGGHGLKLPMIVQTDSCGTLHVAEYQGTVKIFRYLDRTDLQPTGPDEAAIDEDVLGTDPDGGSGGGCIVGEGCTEKRVREKGQAAGEEEGLEEECETAM